MEPPYYEFTRADALAILRHLLEGDDPFWEDAIYVALEDREDLFGPDGEPLVTFGGTPDFGEALGLTPAEADTLR